MNIVISPAKKLDFSKEVKIIDEKDLTEVLLKEKAMKLARQMKKCSVDEIKKMMKLSDNLAKLNFDRYQDFMHKTKSAPAITAFVGDTYKGLNIEEYTRNDLKYAQKNLHILSGLYGVLRPLDKIKPYRLEMGRKLKIDSCSNLYEYWGDDITISLNDFIDSSKSAILVNLASEEYFKSIKKEQVNGQIIDIKFLEKKENTYKVIGLFSKKARGMMASYIIKNRIIETKKLKEFNENAYKYSKNESNQNLFVFKR